MQVHMTYELNKLGDDDLTDTVTQATFSHTFQISVPIVGSVRQRTWGSQVERVA